MKVIYWSDYACPYCYIGEARLKKAIRELNAEDQIALEMKAFQLDPYAGEHAAGDTLTRFAHKYGLTKERAAQQIEGISQLGIAEGLDFKYAATLFTNTMDAHRLTKLAQRRGAADKVIEALFKAYFSDNLELADKELLQRIGEEAGLDAEEVRELLNSKQFEDEVIRDEEEAARNGIHAVPFFVVGDRYGISGAQSVAGMKATLEKALQEEQQRKAALEVESGMTCGPEGCRIQ
jgi:predicted DsbA family dithiol-disulfide isomerase